MSEFDALLWRVEDHPRLSNTVLVVELLDCDPDWDRVRAAHRWSAEFVPILRARVQKPAANLGTPMWVPDEGFNLDRHLRRVVLPAPGTEEQLLAECAKIALEPFDRAHALWEGTLISGFGDRAAFVLKLHHAMADGVAAFQLLRMLHSPTRDATPNKPRPAPLPAGPSSLGGVTAAQLRRQAGQLPGLVSQGARWLIARAIHPGRSLQESLAFLQSAGRAVAPAAPPSPLLADRTGIDWTFAMLEAPMADLKRAGKAAGGTINDAFLAIVLGGVSAYHREQGVPIDALSVFMPISVRDPHAEAGGNRIVAAQLAGPAGDMTATERIQAIRGVVEAARSEPALTALNVAAPILNRLPNALGGAAVSILSASTDVACSNVPGLREPVYMAGARIERVFGFGPLPGSAVLVTLNSHVGTACMGINFDSSVITDEQTFVDCLRRSRDAVLELAG